MIRVNVKSRHRNAPRPAEKDCPPFLKWLRGRPCACGGSNPDCGGGKIQAAHGPHKASKGVSTKAADRWAMPLSVNCHITQHQLGWQTFAARFLRGRDPLEICRAYWTAWLRTPMGTAWERKQAQ